MNRITMQSLATRGSYYRRSGEEKERPKLWNFDSVGANVLLSPKLAAGKMSKGKTMTILGAAFEMYDNPPKKLGRPKIIVIDTTGRGECGCSFEPMEKSNPLFKVLTRQENELPDGSLETFTEEDGTVHPGCNPRGYKVEVMVPLAWTVTGSPALEYDQPTIVRPFTFAISEQSKNDWSKWLGFSEADRAAALHQKVIAAGHAEGWIETAAMEDLLQRAEQIAAKKSGKRKVYTDKQLQTLEQAYARLSDGGLLSPKHVPWNESKVFPWLDMKAVLEDTDTVTMFALDFALNKEQMARAMTVILNSVIGLKDQNNPRKVKNSVVVVVPDMAEVAAVSFAPDEDKYMAPVRERILDLYARGTGNGLCAMGDVQNYTDLDRTIRKKAAELMIFSSDKDEIRDMLRIYNVANKDSFDVEETSRLSQPGSFLWVGAEATEAEEKSGMIPRWNYPRYEREGLSRFSFRELWHSVYGRPRDAPDKWVKIKPYYELVEAVRNEARKVLEESRLAASGEVRPKPTLPLWGPKQVERLSALCAAYEGKGKVEVTAPQAAEAIGDAFGAEVEPENRRQLARTLLEQLLHRRYDGKFCHRYGSGEGGKAAYYTVELKPLRAVLAEIKAGSGVFTPSSEEPDDATPTATGGQTGRSEAAEATARLGEQLKLELLNGNAEAATKLVVELAEFSYAHRDDKDVEAVMVGLLNSKVPLSPEMKAMLFGNVP